MAGGWAGHSALSEETFTCEARCIAFAGFDQCVRWGNAASICLCNGVGDGEGDSAAGEMKVADELLGWDCVE